MESYLPFENYLKNNHISNIEKKFLLLLLNVLNTVDYDPFSIVISLYNLNNASERFGVTTNDITSYLKKYEENKIISFDGKYVHIVSQHFFEFKNSIENFTSSFKETTRSSANELVDELRMLYDNAPEGYQMTYLHLFGIKNKDKLTGHSLSEIVVSALGKYSFVTEVSKGVKLADFVSINDKFKKLVFASEINTGIIKDFTFVEKDVVYDYSKPVYIKFKNSLFPLKNWGEVLKVTCEILVKYYPAQLIRVIKKNSITKSTKNRGNNLYDPLVDENPVLFIDPMKILNSPYYCESKLSSKYAMIYSRQFIEFAGLDLNDFVIGVKGKRN